jgi:hypothetical protein
MRIRSLLLGAVILLLFSIPGFAQGVGTSCDISGTWYGGSDPAYQYLWTISPMAGGRYNSLVQPGFDNRPFGYITWSNWSGEILKIDARTYDQYAMSYFVWAPGSAPEGVDGTLPEVDIVRSRIRLVDCNTLTNSIDVYAGYYNFTPEKTPFVTPVDFDFLAGGVLVETYHRMPTACPACPFPAAVSSATAAMMPKSLKPSSRPPTK